jgi:predicted dehydrogenase
MITGAKPIHTAAAAVTEGGIDLNFSAILRYDSGLIASISSGFNACKQVESVLVGTQGILYIPDTFLDNPGELILKTEKETTKIPVEGADRYRLEVEDFSRAILEGTEPLLNTGESIRNCGVLETLGRQIE